MTPATSRAPVSDRLAIARCEHLAGVQPGGLGAAQCPPEPRGLRADSGASRHVLGQRAPAAAAHSWPVIGIAGLAFPDGVQAARWSALARLRALLPPAADLLGAVTLEDVGQYRHGRARRGSGTSGVDAGSGLAAACALALDPLVPGQLRRRPGAGRRVGHLRRVVNTWTMLPSAPRVIAE